MIQKTQRKIARAQIKQTVDEGIKANDGIRVAGLEGLLRLRSSKGRLQQRERKRLSEKYNAKHARTQQIDTAVDANGNYISGLRMEITRATTPVEKVDENTWVVQGHVYDRQGCPIANAGITLYRADQTKIEAATPVKTNDKGYYRLSSSGEKSAAAEEEAAAGAGLREGGAAEGGQGSSTGLQRVSAGLRINTNLTANVTVFVRAGTPGDPDVYADSTLVTPKGGLCSYRDIIIDTVVHDTTGKNGQKTTRYLGNSATRELHDLKNEKKRCQIDAIRFDHRVSFKAPEQAIAAGYDYCAYCFGKEKSQR